MAEGHKGENYKNFKIIFVLIISVLSFIVKTHVYNTRFLCVHKLFKKNTKINQMLVLVDCETA